MFDREEIKKNLQQSIDQNKPIIGVAVGSGFSAKQAVEGGADFILVLNAGRFRNFGVSSLCCMMPFANSNEMVMKFGSEEILPRIQEKPIIFGACATDPNIDHGMLLERIKKNGFHGVNNFPTIGLIDGKFREALEENGLGFEREVEFMRKAQEKGLFTIGFVFNEHQAMLMAEINVDIVCAHLSWTIGGENSVKQRTSLEEGVGIANRIFESARKVAPDAIFMVYGGPIKDPQQAAFFYENSSAVGYIGGSSFERIPTEIIIRETTDNFKNYEKLKNENEMLKKELIKKKGFDEIVGQSRVILFDEPLAGLSPKERRFMGELVAKIAQEKIALIIEHDMDFALSITEHVTVLNHGVVVSEGSPQEIKNDPKVHKIYKLTGN